MMKIINLVFFAGMILMNYLANAIHLNNKTTGELSNSFPNLFVPAGVTFLIWAIIYILLAGYCIAQFRESYQALSARIGWYFAASCVLNALWIVFWHYGKLPLALLVMIGLLVVLIWINILTKNVQFGLVKASFGIYLGWICIATIANVTVLLVNSNWGRFGFSEEMWAIIMIITGALIAGVSIHQLINPFIGISVIWAFSGIILKRQADFRSIVVISIIFLVLVAAMTLITFLRKNLPG